MPVSLVLCADLYGDAIADWSLSVAVQRIALYDKAKDLDGWACVMKTIKLSAPNRSGPATGAGAGINRCARPKALTVSSLTPK